MSDYLSMSADESADAVAEQTLWRFLSPWQRFTWSLLGRFWVRGRVSGRWYRIAKPPIFPVFTRLGAAPQLHEQLLPGTLPVRRFCLQVRGSAYEPGREEGAIVWREDEDGFLREVPSKHDARRIPLADVVLAQKLLIEADERRFRATANVLRRWPFDLVDGPSRLPRYS
jgi:hypothetical protein